MCRRCLRSFLLIVGCVLLFFAAFPVLAFFHFDGMLETELMASKLLMMPVGALCLLAGALLSKEKIRH